MDNSRFAEKLRIALELARKEAWDHPIPKTTMRLSILLQMLSKRFPVYWDEDIDHMLHVLLQDSQELAVKLDEFDSLTLGFAMRTQRFVKRSLDRSPKL